MLFNVKKKYIVDKFFQFFVDTSLRSPHAMFPVNVIYILLKELSPH